MAGHGEQDETTNPRALRREMHAGLDELLRSRPAVPPVRTPATDVAA